MASPLPETLSVTGSSNGSVTNNGHEENDSENEDDPGHLLNVWLGELNTLKRVRKIIHDFF